MKRRTFLKLSSILSLLPFGSSACGKGYELRKLKSSPLPEERSVNFGFEDVSNPNYDWAAVAKRLVNVNATAASICVGRIEWVCFDWEGHPDTQASINGADWVQKAIDALNPMTINLTIDTLVPNMIHKNSDLAGVDPGGEKSDKFASVSAIRDGEVGDGIVDLAKTIAHRYNPNSISLTELMFDNYTFGDDDLDSYKRFSGESDWPRKDGQIDTRNTKLGEWRSEALEHLISRIKAEIPSNVSLDMDVRAPWDNPNSDRAMSGHDYDLLLTSADRISVWNYNGMNERTPEYSEELAESFSRRYGQRYTMSTGLWAEDEANTIPADDMALSLRYSAKGGATAVSVTPASRLSEEHWKMLESAWKG